VSNLFLRNETGKGRNGETGRRGRHGDTGTRWKPGRGEKEKRGRGEKEKRINEDQHLRHSGPNKGSIP